MEKTKLHHNWKGNDASYVSKHEYIKRHYGKASVCVDCNTKDAKKYEWSNISGLYKREISDWEQLCTSCHKKKDLARLAKRAGYKKYCVNGHEYNQKNLAFHKKTGYVYCKECNRLRSKSRGLINELRK